MCIQSNISFQIPQLLLWRNSLNTGIILLVFCRLWYSYVCRTFLKGSTEQYYTPMNYISGFRKGSLYWYYSPRFISNLLESSPPTKFLENLKQSSTMDYFPHNIMPPKKSNISDMLPPFSELEEIYSLTAWCTYSFMHRNRIFWRRDWKCQQIESRVPCTCFEKSSPSMQTSKTETEAYLWEIILTHKQNIKTFIFQFSQSCSFLSLLYNYISFVFLSLLSLLFSTSKIVFQLPFFSFLCSTL